MGWGGVASQRFSPTHSWVTGAVSRSATRQPVAAAPPTQESSALSDPGQRLLEEVGVRRCAEEGLCVEHDETTHGVDIQVRGLVKSALNEILERRKLPHTVGAGRPAPTTLERSFRTRRNGCDRRVSGWPKRTDKPLHVRDSAFEREAHQGRPGLPDLVAHRLVLVDGRKRDEDTRRRRLATSLGVSPPY